MSGERTSTTAPPAQVPAAGPTSALGSEALLRSVFDAAIDAIITIDDRGTVLGFNGGAERSFGYRADEVIGNNVSMLMPEPNRSMHDAHVARVREMGEPRAIGMGREVEGRRKDGSTFPIHVALSEAFVEGRRLITGIARDLSELHDAARALRDTEQQLRVLVEGVADHALVLLDAHGCIEQSNAGLERLTGYADGALVGQTTSVLNEPGDDPAPLLAAAIANGTAEQEGWRVRADGSRFAANVVVTAIYDEVGELRGFAKIIRDVSERRAAEAAREQYQANMRQAERLENLGQLAGGVAHDFNNLLSVILGSATLLETAIYSFDLPGHVREALLCDVREIEHAGERGAALTRQLLMVGRRSVVRIEPLDLREVIAEVTELLRRTLGAHVDLVVRTGSEVLPIHADRGQLGQVLLNLAVNARDAMPGGGTLTIAASRVELGDEFVAAEPRLNRGPYVRIAVSDTGCGMDPDTVAHAFEPFFTTKPVGKGTGLGLASVYGIVTGAGGTVRLASEPEVGTSVIAYLPEAPAPDAVAQPEPASARDIELSARPWTRGRHVLLVEDEPAVRQLARRLLEMDGIVVTSASNAAEALALAKTEARTCDLLLTDIVMPGTSGRELAEQMRAIRPDLAVLFTSGYAAGTDTQGALLPGERLLEKPFTRDELIQSIEAVLAPG